MEFYKEPIMLNHILKEIKRLKHENAKIKRRLSALEQSNMEQQLEITNINRRIQNDFPVGPWDTD